MLENPINKNGIVLFAKQAGQTSFSSLFTIKHALNTKKVGHTGTLDSFAQGLLIVCSGNCTRLVSYITEFDKTYQAVIEFGRET
ncbi:MAG: tRNA pseudouridine(55) synthase TruB, partial [Treponemataceae bacterium]|nr:tRNA pseudouridine(55) synthase TruB [Treponemataceae bacterium]